MKSEYSVLSQSIYKKIKSYKYECLICYKLIRPNSPETIWTCENCCYAVFHWKCISKWKQCGSRSESCPSLLLRCPACRFEYHLDNFPPEKECFCGKQVNKQETDPLTLENQNLHSNNRILPSPNEKPSLNSSINNYCCKRICGKLIKGCSHSCRLPCHPGPCQSCKQLVTQSCYCGKEKRFSKCKDLKDNTFSCKKVCAKILDCGKHGCKAICHDGECPKCTWTTLPISCKCGKESRQFSCLDLAQFGLEFSCNNQCNNLLDCGKHFCMDVCHIDCQLKCSKRHQTHCYCGKQQITDDVIQCLMEDCDYVIPSCTSKCGKVLKCGHECKSQCHSGQCDLVGIGCEELVEISCCCGNETKLILCSEKHFVKFSCKTKCNKLKDCGKHSCNELCCPFNSSKSRSGDKFSTSEGLSCQSAINGANLVQSTISRMNVAQPAIENINLTLPAIENINLTLPAIGNINLAHQCTIVCGKKLNCSVHFCQDYCHTGRCSPCPMVSFDELVCHCGLTKVLPPVYCNTILPECSHPCRRIRGRCQEHLYVDTHLCHPEEECPRCAVLVKVPCYCGASILTEECWKRHVKKVCGKRCSKQLSCGHFCSKPCHPGDCGVCAVICNRSDVPPSCGHSCKQKCHFGQSCDSFPDCLETVEVSCPCGNIKLSIPCHVHSKEGPISCNDECSIRQRRENLAKALGIEEKPDNNVFTSYSDFLVWFSRDNFRFCLTVENVFKEFSCKNDLAFHCFPPMNWLKRKFVREYADVWSIEYETVDPEPIRTVILWKRRSSPSILQPTVLLSDFKDDIELEEDFEEKLDSSSGNTKLIDSFYNGLEIKFTEETDYKVILNYLKESFDEKSFDWKLEEDGIRVRFNSYISICSLKRIKKFVLRSVFGSIVEFVRLSPNYSSDEYFDCED